MMDIRTASGGVITADTRKGRRTFQPLTVGDLGELQAQVPGDDQRFVTVFQLHQWAMTPQGCDPVILASLRRGGEDPTPKQVAALGSIVERVQIARLIMSESLMSGEEGGEEGDNAPKAGDTGTG